MVAGTFGKASGNSCSLKDEMDVLSRSADSQHSRNTGLLDIEDVERYGTGAAAMLIEMRGADQKIHALKVLLTVQRHQPDTRVSGHFREFMLEAGTSFWQMGSWENGRKQSKAYLRSLSAEERAALYDYVSGLKAELCWGEIPLRVHNANYHDLPRLDEAQRFESHCEYLVIRLCEVGFAVNQARAQQVLSELAAGNIGFRLRGAAAFAKPTIAVLRNIVSALNKGMALSDRARQDATRIFKIYHDAPVHNQEWTGDHVNLDKTSLALQAIAGEQKQDTFFARLRPNKEFRAISWLVDELLLMKLRFYEQLVPEARRQFEVIKPHFESDRQPASWVTEPSRFVEYFGNFPGWTLESGQSVWQLFLEKFRSDRPAGSRVEDFSTIRSPDWSILTDEEVAAVVDFVQGSGNDLQPVYSKPGVPHIELWTFAGSDPDGDFLNHLVSLEASKPTKAWRATTQAHIKRLGAANVRRVIDGWVQNLGEVDIPEAQLPLAQRAFFVMHFVRGTMVRLGSNRLVDQVAKMKQSVDDPVLIRQRALDTLILLPQSIRSSKSDWRNYSVIREHIVTACTAPLSDNNELVMRGIVWALAEFPDKRSIDLLKHLGRELFTKRRSAFRSLKCGNAVLWSLGEIGSCEAVFALARIRRSVKDKAVAKLVDRILTREGQKVGLSLDDMHELAFPDYGIGAGGTREELLGHHRVSLQVTASGKAQLTTLDTSQSKPKQKRGIPKAVLTHPDTADLAAELKGAATDIARILPEARRRLENTWRHDRNWAFADWKERFVDNGLLATLANRLIWSVTGPDGSIAVMMRDDQLVTCDGARVEIEAAGARVSLWHPLHASTDEITAWRSVLIEKEIHQPFLQAWRPVYAVADAEIETASYSNRFAGHILHQAPVIAMLRQRGWTANSADHLSAPNPRKPNQILLPAHGVAAEYSLAGIGHVHKVPDGQHGSGSNHVFVTTDRVTFHAVDPDSNEPGEQPVPVADVPAMAFSEIMRDLDLVIGVTSIGNDRFWSDRGPDAGLQVDTLQGADTYRNAYAKMMPGELLEVRRDFLKRIIPALAISDRCQVQETVLKVRGDVNTYLIHLGSGNVHIQKSGRYVCIVKEQYKDVDDHAHLPFVGDEVLSLVLSKAILLADDSNITDQTIRSQIGL